MRYHDTVYLRIEELVCSEDFDQRLPMPHVGELAASIREVGVIHRPWVRFGSHEVIAGEDRIAAQVLLNVDGVEVDVWEMTDEEVAKVREHENRFRRPHSTAELAQMVARKLETMRPPPMPEPEPEERHVGRKKLDKTRAIEEVAEETGRSKEAVRKAAEREAKRAAKASAKEPEEPRAVPFETWGRAVSPELLDGANEAHRSLTDAACKVQAAMAALTKLQTKAIVHDSLANRLYADLKACAHELRAARPVALCAWCKGQDGMVTQCAACFGLGHLSEGVAGSIPEALKDPRKVMVAGQEQRLPSERPAHVPDHVVDLDSVVTTEPFGYATAKHADEEWPEPEGVDDLFGDVEEVL